MQKGTSNMKMLTMQGLSILSKSHSFNIDEISPVPTKLDQDFKFKHRIQHPNEEKLEEQEFSFACPDHPHQTLIFADEIFNNGQIRPSFYASDQSLIFTTTQDDISYPLRRPLKKLFVEKHNCFDLEPSGFLKEETHDVPSTMVEVETSKEGFNKSNSTGFSKLWRFRRDMNFRSNSDSKDAFVFLNHSVTTRSNKEKEESLVQKKEKRGKNHRLELSPHEKLYVMNRMRKEKNKRRSFLPYRQQLVGIFTNINGLSRNLHPF